jgi:predicted DCC family thiol-disulfide oxidoreductase YuxK
MPRTIGDAPDRLILLDGVCVLCSWWVRFVIERDAGARFRFVATQTPRGSALAKRFEAGMHHACESAGKNRIFNHAHTWSHVLSEDTQKRSYSGNVDVDVRASRYPPEPL